jgi:hypothetical protein
MDQEASGAATDKVDDRVVARLVEHDLPARLLARVRGQDATLRNGRTVPVVGSAR